MMYLMYNTQGKDSPVGCNLLVLLSICSSNDTDITGVIGHDAHFVKADHKVSSPNVLPVARHTPVFFIRASLKKPVTKSYQRRCPTRVIANRAVVVAWAFTVPFFSFPLATSAGSTQRLSCFGAEVRLRFGFNSCTASTALPRVLPLLPLSALIMTSPRKSTSADDSNVVFRPTPFPIGRRFSLSSRRYLYKVGWGTPTTAEK